MGVVYRAIDPNDNSQVALKVLLAGRWADSVLTQRFLREAKAASRLNHPGLVHVIESGEIQGQLYLAMNLVPGPSLRQVIDRGGVSVDEAARIVLHVARALDYAHQAGVTHRDVKPENILLDDERMPVLTDFGLVLEVEDTRLTHTGQVMGTPAYLAPELARGVKKPDWQSCDVYALGAVLYELLTGQPVYDGDSAMQVLLDVLAGPPPTPSSIAPSIPPSLYVLTLRALARDPMSRLSSTGDLADDLQRYLDGQKIRTQPLSPVYQLRQWANTHQRSLGISASAVAVSAAIAGTMLGTGAQQTVQANQLREEQAAAAWQQVAPQVDAFEAAGQVLEADAAFVAWLGNDSWSGTQARTRSWVHRTEQLNQRGDADAAIDAAAHGWVEASTPDLRTAALQQLTHLLVADWRDDTAWALLQNNLELPNAEKVAISQGHAEQAPAWLQTLIGQTTALPDAQRVTAMPNGQWLARTDSVGVMLGPDGQDLGPSWLVPSSFYPVGPGLAVGWDPPNHAALYAVSEAPTPLVPLLQWTDSVPLDALAISNGKTLEPSIFVAVGPYARTLSRLDYTDGVWTRADAHQDTTLAGSDVLALAAFDVNQDGRDELAASIGPWNAYDIRLFEEGAEGLQLTARRKMGFVSDLTPLQIQGKTVLAALKTQDYPSRRAFPARNPYGLPSGVHLLDAQDSLHPLAVLSLDEPIWDDRLSGIRLQTADLDGDRLDDLVAEVHIRNTPHLLLYRQQTDGSFVSYRLDGLMLHHVSNLDADPASELVVGRRTSEDTVGPNWILGLGDTPLPTSPTPSLQDTSRAEQAAALHLFIDSKPKAKIDASLKYTVQFSSPLDEAWHISAPLSLRRDLRGGTLTADALLGQGTLARLPLQSTSGPITLQVEMALERLEWASGLSVQLVSGDLTVGAGFTGWGGGALLQRQLGCPSPSVGPTPHRTRAEPGDLLEVVATASYDPESHVLTCHFEDKSGRVLHHTSRTVDGAPDGDNWWLELTDAGATEVNSHMWARVSLTSVKLGGVAPRPASPTQLSANRWIEGDPEGALASEPTGLLRAATLASLGKPALARQAMVQTTALEQSLLLRTHPTLGPPVLRDFLGERWFPVWYEAHAVALQTHPEDPLLHGRTLTDLQGLSAWRPLTADDYAIQTALFFVRGRTRWLTGASTMGDARADLQRAVATAPAVLERALEQQDAEGIVQSTRILVDGHALLASLFLASGDEAAALVHVEASLKWAPSPTVAIDRLLLDDRVRAQRLDPAWATLLGGADATP